MQSGTAAAPSQPLCVQAASDLVNLTPGAPSLPLNDSTPAQQLLPAAASS